MKCQICGCEEKKILSRLCSNMKIMGPFFPDQDSYVAACKRCGSVFVDTDAGQRAFTKYYESEYSKSLSYMEVFGQEEALPYYKNIERRIANYVPRDGRILEIGGGIGELANFFRGGGYTDVTVMEPSERCIRLCRERGLKTIHSDGFQVPRELENSFDFIIINHTLEHILDFHKTLASAHRMLKPGCSMYIEVPDAAKYAETDFVPYWFFTYEHIVHMCLESFDNLARVFSYDVRETESYLKCHSYHVMYGILTKSDRKRKEPVRLDCVEAAVNRYIRSCEERLKPVMDKIRQENVPVILWGVGTSTAQLLNGNFDHCNVVKLVDSNPYRQNVVYTVAGKNLKIEDPSSIHTDDMILILPLMYDASIRRQIKEMGLKNRVQSLIENYKTQEESL